VAHSYTAPLEKDFRMDANGARVFIGHFLCGGETVMGFMNDILDCNLINLKQISKISRYTLLENFLRTLMAALTLSANFEIWASQVKLTTNEIEN